MTDNCGDAATPVSGATVTIANTAGTVVYASGVTNAEGHVQLPIPAAGDYYVTTIADCEAIVAGRIALTCDPSDYPLKAWQKATLGPIMVRVYGPRCNTDGKSWRDDGTVVHLGGASAAPSEPYPYGGNAGQVLFPGPMCGAVDVNVTPGQIYYYQSGASTRIVPPRCTTRIVLVSMTYKTGWFPCCHPALGDGIVSQKVLLSDSKGSAVIVGGNGINQTVCQGTHSRAVEAEHVAPSSIYANGWFICPRWGPIDGGLVPYPVIGTSGGTSLSYAWGSDGAGGFTCTQSTPHACHAWAYKDETGLCQLPWYKQVSRAATGTEGGGAGFSGSSIWTSTGYTVNSTAAGAKSITFYWSQDPGSYAIVTDNNANCGAGHSIGPLVSSMTLTELSP